MEKKVQLPLFGRDAQVAPESFNADANTIDIVWTTGAAVRRCDYWDGTEFDEVLSLEAGAVRLERLNLGAPFLDTHCSYGLDNVIGSIVPGTAKIEDGRGIATVLMSKAAGVADTVQKIREGVIRNISVGYWTHKIIKTEGDDGKVARWDVIDWEPLEISAVPIPADAGSHIRASTRSEGDKNDKIETRSCTVVTKEAATAPTPKVDKEKRMPKISATANAAEAEKLRLAALRAAKRDEDKKDDEEADDKRDDEDMESDEESAADTSDTGKEDDADDKRDAAEDDDDEEDGKRAALSASAKRVADAAVKADRARAAEIRTLAARAGLPKFGEKHANADTSVRKFRDLMFDRMLDKQTKASNSQVSAPGERSLDPKLANGGKGHNSAERDAEAGAAMARKLLGKPVQA